jgi:transglutaminase-like putative cysteine protease
MAQPSSNRLSNRGSTQKMCSNRLSRRGSAHEMRLALLCCAPLLGAAAAPPHASAHASAVAFLARHCPPRDTAAGVDFAAHAQLALRARAATPWAAAVPWELFCDAVLPYACLDEPRREGWRELLYERCRPLVADAATTTEAALALNAALWETLGVRYEPNMSPALLAPLDVVDAGRASCSGLSLLLVAACRAVGVPSRVAGVGDWGARHGGGNHVWVEVCDDVGVWHAIGAAEPDALGRTWFGDRLRPADGPRVFASTYRRPGGGPGHRFPLPWQADGEAPVPAVEVTARYREGGA